MLWLRRTGLEAMRAEQAQWGWAELLAAMLKGVLGLYSEHSHCPRVVGVTGQ